MQFKSNVSSGVTSPHLITLKDGENVRGVLRGEIYEFQKDFKGNGKFKFRFQVNMVVKGNGALAAKILEGGAQLYGQLRDLQSAGWDLETTTIQVSRKGSGQFDTEYNVVTVPNGSMTGDALSKIAAVRLHELTPREPSSPREPGDEMPSDDLPF